MNHEVLDLPYPQLSKPIVALSENHAPQMPFKQQSLTDFELRWADLNYTIKRHSISWNACRPRRKLELKRILSNLSGTIKSGQLAAVLGPSGSGKSTCKSIILNAFSCIPHVFHSRKNAYKFVVMSSILLCTFC